MSEAKHTPGPWELSGGIHLVGNPLEGGQHSLYCADIRHRDYIGGICTIQSADHCPPAGITRGTAEANARLIAAAPDLLSALRIADAFCGSLTSDVCPDDVHIPIRDAIAKATGSGS